MMSDSKNIQNGCDSPKSNSTIEEDDLLMTNHSPQLDQLISLPQIYKAYKRLKNVVNRTPIHKSTKLSEEFQANIYLKREDLQIIRSYKLRGAYNLISQMSEDQRHRTVFCASAGNHAQGVAYSCNVLKIKACIFMPAIAQKQKIEAVRSFGKEFCEIVLIGSTYDECYQAAQARCQQENGVFAHPFDDEQVIAGQGSLGIEVLEDIPEKNIDYFIFPIGGGGCASGIVSFFKQASPQTVMIGVSPLGAPSMREAIRVGHIQELKNINTFVDGASIKKSGQWTFKILSSILKDVHLVPELQVCHTMLKMINQEGLLIEPAGCLAISALENFREKLKGKTVVCLVSGGNIDLGRMSDIRTVSDMNRESQHYLYINFCDQACSVKQFVSQCLGDEDELTSLQYTKKTKDSRGPALVGIKTRCFEDFENILKRLDENNLEYRIISPNKLIV
ncbi:hypothetical protein pb186bvf_015583 [Paramecium bursaria]